METDYPKINTLFKRDENNIIIPTAMTCDEFEYLKNCKWECTEKIDGTNMHVDLVGNKDGELEIKFYGKTDKTNIPQHLKEKLTTLFTIETLQKTFADQLNDILHNGLRVSIYGEGYGMKIQKGGNYISKDVGFILFDVKVGDWWLKRNDCEIIAEKINIPIVPLIGYMTISEAIEYVRTGFKSTVSENKEYEAEGLVLKTPLGLKFRNGERIITKLKTVDFRKYNQKYGNAIVEQKVNTNYNESKHK